MTSDRHDRLPDGFQDLEPYVADWCLPKEGQRVGKRWVSSLEDITRFYDAMLPRLEAVLDYLDQRDLEDFSERDANLYHLAMSLVEAASSVEIYKRPSSQYSMSPERYVRTE